MTFSPLARKRRRPPSPASPPIMNPAIPEIVASLPMTPPDPDGPPKKSLQVDAFPLSIGTAVHVISTERAALANLERIYLTDRLAQNNMELAVTWAAKTVGNGGKVVVSGVGKSGKIGQKAVATMNSIGVQSAFLHPTEALHGDLGMVKPNDTVVLISFSGKSPELLSLISHLPPTVFIVAITSHTQPSSCPLLFNGRKNAALLPAPVHEHEDVSFGLSAPTTSTTVALAVCDALALAIARRLHTTPGRGPAEVFKEYHPGGAIGAAIASSSYSTPVSSISTSDSDESRNPTTPPAEHRYITDIATPLSIIPSASSPQPGRHVHILDVLRTAIRYPAAKSWVLLSPTQIIPPRCVCSLSEENDVNFEIGQDSVFDKKDWFPISRSMTIRDAQEAISKLLEKGEGNDSLDPHSTFSMKRKGTPNLILSIVDETSGDILSVVDSKDIFPDD